MADYTPVYNPGHEVTFTATTPLVGGQVVEVTGPMSVGAAGAASARAVGVAGNDAAAGSRVTVFLGGFVHESTTAGVVAAGDALSSGAAGTVATQATPTAVNLVGIALAGAASGAVVRWVTR